MDFEALWNGLFCRSCLPECTASIRSVEKACSGGGSRRDCSSAKTSASVRLSPPGPPEAVGRQLTLVASDVTVRILDGSFEIARHNRTYDRHQIVLDPAHQEAVLKLKRKAFHSTPGGRLEQAVPESKTLVDLAFAHGESAGAQTAQLMKLLEQYGAAALRRAIAEALQRNTPRASSVAFLLRRQPRATPLSLDLSHHPQAQALDIQPHDLETYDELARAKDDDKDEQ
jgi:hypothetical protein